ncbi:SRPBCC domain-containing protein [Mucilaginibacter sp. RB4R14]|uniref:SRPBCC family protein n=1 Tax=Mucilaginibacter aurantiaciroseus TaxID=2949308 RepID=UPI0020904A43|nr:SRPBCC family protein [Mucilaginibacter aurantiaciroseus]MCO5935346.1 SRPBCC domain-containing protein [Mucilaginibacter aurantiaciroseus]
MSKLTLTTRVIFKASSAEVWKGLTDPEVVKQYFFGTILKSDWKEGSPITFSGEWDGKSYEDKGFIKEIVPGKYVRYSYWSIMAGTEDKPENYADVSYELNENGDITVLTIIQDNIKDEASKEHSENNWQMMFNGLKKLIER